MTQSGELPLPGGFVSQVVRIGDTVRRRPGPRPAYVQDLLGLLAAAGWAGAPRFLGADQQGREILSFIEGDTAWQPGLREAVSTDACLAHTARLVRQLHDLTAGTAVAGNQEVACHNDLSPRNTVYRGTPGQWRPVAFIDWDLAAPGLRIHDVAHTCWQYPGLGPQLPDPAGAARKVRLICDAYGLDDRSAVVDTILWWQDRCWRGIETGARAGDPAMRRLRDAGAVTAVREQHRWVSQHHRALDAALS